jgi:Predicted signal transduction protein with a C-terminal ATPase domain
MKLFEKVFAVYAAVIILALSMVSYVISFSISTLLLKKEIQYNELITYYVNSLVQKKCETITQILRQAYSIKINDASVLGFLENDLDSTDTDFIISKGSFDSFFNSVFWYDKDIINILVWKKANDSTYLYSNYAPQFPDYENSFPLREHIKKKYSFAIPEAYPAHQPFKGIDKTVFSLCVNLQSLDNNEKNMGVLMVDFDVNGMTAAMKEHYKNANSDILVLEKNGGILFDSSGKYYGESYPFYGQMLAGINKTTRVRLDGKDYMVTVNRDNDIGVLVVGVLPIQKVMAGMFQMKFTIHLVAALFIIAAIFISYFLAGSFSKRIKRITCIMNDVQQGNLQVRIPERNSKDELDEIAKAFNQMCENLDIHIHRVYISQIKQKNAELTALQSQINPHFLYNTLEAIRVKAVKGGMEDVGEMILLLSKLFRLNVKGNAIITIYEEVKYSTLYLELFKIRFGERLSYIYDIPDNIYEYGIIKHVIQPVIENYIIHGFVSSRKDNLVRITAYKLEEFVFFEISDNGSGIHPEKLVEIQKSIDEAYISKNDNLGLANVHSRIRMIFGDDCGLDIWSTYKEGTTVTVKIKATLKKELEKDVQGIVGG